MGNTGFVESHNTAYFTPYQWLNPIYHAEITSTTHHTYIKPEGGRNIGLKSLRYGITHIITREGITRRNHVGKAARFAPGRLAELLAAVTSTQRARRSLKPNFDGIGHWEIHRSSTRKNNQAGRHALQRRHIINRGQGLNGAIKMPDHRRALGLHRDNHVVPPSAARPLLHL
jgi:hypothetical protein